MLHQEIFTMFFLTLQIIFIFIYVASVWFILSILSIRPDIPIRTLGCMISGPPLGCMISGLPLGCMIAGPPLGCMISGLPLGCMISLICCTSWLCSAPRWILQKQAFHKSNMRNYNRNMDLRKEKQYFYITLIGIWNQPMIDLITYIS